jgi:hypothetical protein
MKLGAAAGWWVGVTSVTLLVASAARAQPAATARDPAKAETLFKSAKALLDAGDWGAACPKFQASADLDPSVSALLKMARCHEHDGKLAAAWNDVSEALKLNRALAQPEKRRRELDDYANKMLADLDKRVPRLRLRAATVPLGLHLSQDGQPLPVAALGERLPVDAGPHEIVAESPGFAPFHASVTLAEGQALDVDIVLVPVPLAGEAPTDPKPAALPPEEAQKPPAPPATPATPGDPGKTRRAAGIGLGAFGVASLGGALALGLLTMNRVSAARPLCAPDFSTCPTAGTALLDQARGMQAGAFVLLGVGAVATGTGVALFATAPRASAAALPRPEVSAVVGPLGAALRGAW